MKSTHTLITYLFFLNIMCFQGQNITFNVNLNGSEYPTTANHIMRIVANPGEMGWNGNFVELTDANNDGIYTGSVSGVSSDLLLFQVRQGDPDSNSWGTLILPTGCDASGFDGENYSVIVTDNLTIDFSIQQCLKIEKTIKRWDFNTLEGWTDSSQNTGGKINYNIEEGGFLNITSRANTWDRSKIKTVGKLYTYGRYFWKIFVPEMGVGDMASIGAFLYHDDTHELDFEIGYGTSIVRQQLNATADDLIVYVTSQANPFKSIPKKIKRNKWYIFSIELLEVEGKYQAIWYLDNEELLRLNLEYGGVPFYILCSLENLSFLGDHIPKQNNYAKFDYVEFNNLNYKKTIYTLNKK